MEVDFKKESSAKKPASLPQMALDVVETGNDDLDSYGRSERVTKELPEGVTSKALYRDIIRIAWPSFIELTLTQLTSMADMIMIGQLGSWAIAGVGLTNQPKFLAMTLFMAMQIGATALIARYKGAGDRKKANLILRQSLMITTSLALISSILGFIFAEELVLFMGADNPQTLAAGTDYLKIQMLGLVFLAITSNITAALRGVGNSRTAMIYNLTANVVNVVLNYVLINGHFGFPRMGVAGASLATVIGQLVAFTMAIGVVLSGRSYLHLRFRDGFKPNMEVIKSIFNIGLPSMGEQAAMRTGVIIYIRTVASLGTAAYATHQIGMNIQALSFMNGQAFGVSATSLMGQSLGKKRPDMAQAYSSRTRFAGMLVSMVLGLIFWFFGETIVGFYSNEPEVIAMGAQILKLMALVQPFQSSQFILAGGLRGAGDTRWTAVITLVTVLGMRPWLAKQFINHWELGLMGAWYALVADQLVRSALVLLRYKSGKWKLIKV